MSWQRLVEWVADGLMGISLWWIENVNESTSHHDHVHEHILEIRGYGGHEQDDGERHETRWAPGRLLRRFLEPKSLTREKTLRRLGFSHALLALFGLLAQRQTLDFSRSLACLFCRIRELAIAAAIASVATSRQETRAERGWFPPLRSSSVGFQHGSVNPLTSNFAYQSNRHCSLWKGGRQTINSKLCQSREV